MSVLEEIFHSSTRILPEWILFFGILATCLALAFTKEDNKSPFYLFALTVMLYVYSLIISAPQVTAEGRPFYQGLLHLDKKALLIKQLTGIAAIIFMVHARLFSYKFPGEVYALTLFVLFGISFLSMTTHFMTAYVSLELISLASYVLVASGKMKKNFEAGIKYLIFGAVASAIMLFGISLFYGLSHSLNFSSPEFAESLARNPAGPVRVISFMVLGGFLFKIAAAPFHQWVPDVYESTSTPVISFLSFAPKAAGFIFISRMVAADFTDLNYALALVIILSLVVGNFAALWQNDFKRLLGYSGIAQSGFILTGMITGNNSDGYGTFFYLVAYLPMTMGSFFLVDFIWKKARTLDIPSMAGLGKKYPLLGINALVILISLVGLPPTIGFLAKLVVFSSLADAASSSSGYLLYGLLIFGLFNAAIALYYYLRPAYMMIIHDPAEKSAGFTYDLLITLVLSYFSFTLIYLFIKPDFISEWVSGIF